MEKRTEWAEDEEIREWLDSLQGVLDIDGAERAEEILKQLRAYARGKGLRVPSAINTPYINTIPVERQPPYPGRRDIERRIKSIVRWNAMAMVVRANRRTNVGGHISTYASAATLFEVGYNHFFRGKDHPCGGDQIYLQGHAAPGIYARAYLEGRLSESQLENYRQELQPGGGLSSYPHPHLMPSFWEYPTVNMGLGPLSAVHQAYFNRYLVDRGLKEHTDAQVWCLLGDGETDEPETIVAFAFAGREKLDNMNFVVNCNLQRLDGPVRGNSKIIQELEGICGGAGCNVIKVIWGENWDPLLANDKTGALVRRMEEVVDGQYQKYIVAGGDYIRSDFFGHYPELLELVRHFSDEELTRLCRGGHDPDKVYAAYRAAVDHRGAPTVILAKTVKGYGLGEAGEGKNITHQQKAMNEEELREFRARFGIPISDEDVAEAPFFRPADDSPEMAYLHERRAELGGPVPNRRTHSDPITMPNDTVFEEFYAGTTKHEPSTTMVFINLLKKLLKDPGIGELIVPIVPDEARTFGMDTLFRDVGIYSHVGQLYEPVDLDSFLYYKEAVDGQVIEAGINEAGSICSFIAAGTGYSVHGINTIPFFIFYSMFGFQRIGDIIWHATDTGARGFLLGATAGRTTLNGEGLQHQDGHSLVLASTYPKVIAYDPAYAYEIAVIVKEGLRRMYVEQDNVIFYLTLQNENYAMPPMPEGAAKGIIKGMYKLSTSGKTDGIAKVTLLGSASILQQVLKARDRLEADYNIAADVWSVTSFTELRRDALDAERWNMLHPDETPRQTYVGECLKDEAGGVFVVATDYIKALPDGISRWIPGEWVPLGTDGFGRSDTREALRDFFEIDDRYITVAALTGLARQGTVDNAAIAKAISDLGINPQKMNPQNS